VAVVTSQDNDYLKETSRSLPDDAELVVGIGGGVGLDAAKHIALRKGLPLVLVPTIVSTGAMIHGIFHRWKGNDVIWPPPGTNHVCDPEHVLVDCDLVLKAPDHLNTAGLGDILCGFAGIAEWRHDAERGTAPVDYEDAVEPLLAWYRYIADEFPATLSPDGAMTGESVRFIATMIQERDDRAIRSPHAPGADHVIQLTIESVCNRTFVHGDMTALGSVIVAWITGQHEEHLDRLDRCSVRYRPAAMGMSRDELRRSLEALPHDLTERGVDSILGREPVVGARFDELWAFLDGTRIASP